MSLSVMGAGGTAALRPIKEMRGQRTGPRGRVEGRTLSSAVCSSLPSSSSVGVPFDFASSVYATSESPRTLRSRARSPNQRYQRNIGGLPLERPLTSTESTLFDSSSALHSSSRVASVSAGMEGMVDWLATKNVVLPTKSTYSLSAHHP